MIKVLDRSTLSQLENDLHCQLIDKIEYIFSEDLKNINFEVITTYKPKNEIPSEVLHQTISIDKEKYKGRLIGISLLRLDDVYRKYSDIIFSTKYTYISADEYKGTTFERFNVISLFIPENYDDENEPILVLPHVRCVENGNRNGADLYEEINYSAAMGYGQRQLISYDPRIEEIVEKWTIKRHYLMSLMDPTESLGYLEIQVDLLTKIIEKICLQYNIDISEYREILDKIEEYNVINTKSNSKIILELEKDKGNIRKIQRDYYERIYPGREKN